MRIGIIGLGLIGGSFALAAKKFNIAASLYGRDNNPKHMAEALSLGIIDYPLKEEDYASMDVILLAIPVDACLTVVLPLLDQINDNALLLDAGSTKAAICKLVELHPKRNQFLATHPIAGTEFSGPSAAIHGLFRNKTNIICEVEKTLPALGEVVLTLFKTMGMHLRFMPANDHDKHIAYVSHLSHISSFMLGKTVIEKEKNERDIFDMAGSGFESTVRLAKSSPDMWAPIFEQNKVNVIETLTEYIQNLNQFKAYMEKDDFDAVHNEMKNTNHIKQILKGIG